MMSSVLSNHNPLWIIVNIKINTDIDWKLSFYKNLLLAELLLVRDGLGATEAWEDVLETVIIVLSPSFVIIIIIITIIIIMLIIIDIITS